MLLSETIITNLTNTPFDGYGPLNWIEYYVSRYGNIYGNHHQTWLNVEVMKLRFGIVPEVKLAKFDNHHADEWRVHINTTNAAYNTWLTSLDEDVENEGTYNWAKSQPVPP